MTALPDDAGLVLTRLARSAIATQLNLPAAEPDGEAEWLNERGAAFVTLTIDGRLRGCIGSLEAWRWLGEDVRSNAVSAAFRDPRFPPLSRDEFAQVDVEVSVLTPPQELSFTSEADALAQLRPDIDGVILEAGSHRATFLPQVWEDLPDKRVFMAHLKRKARLAADYWGDDVRLHVYQVSAFHE
ncbi:MAG: AmmeMemoRadiSam system protein A [Propionibacteriaceae bacterium]|jgi:AmmeMemoRadiSam system protein A|nr:AmmeMemoRadiSam system protein A [Propionibacteriaceae bacterium]